MAEREALAFDRNALVHLGRLVEFLVHRPGKPVLDLLERDAVLRPLRPGERRLDRRQFELEHVGKYRVWRVLGAIHALRLGIGDDQRDKIRRAAGVAQVADGVVVDREEAAGRAVFGRHVADRGAVGDREAGQTGAEIFDEFADDAALAQNLRHGKHEIGGGDAFLELAVEPHADHLRQQHRIGLAEHRRFGLDAADAPAEHRQPVDHGGVRVGADQRVRIGEFGRDRLVGKIDLGFRAPHHARQIFEIDLVADAGPGRHHAEILERALRPFQEAVAFLVLLVFFLDVLLERVLMGEEIHRHRMVDDEIDRHQRVDFLRIAAEMLHRIAHRGEIDHRRHAGEILHQYPRRPERDFAVRGLGLQPLRDGLDVLLAHRAAVFVAQQVFQQDLERKRQPRNPLQTVLLGRRQAVIGVGLGTDLERPQTLEAVERIHDFFPILPAARRNQSEVIYCPKRPPTGRQRMDAAALGGSPQSMGGL